MLTTGVTKEALADAIHVAALFNMIVRLADSLGWDVPPFEAFSARAAAMLAGGYVLEAGQAAAVSPDPVANRLTS